MNKLYQTDAHLKLYRKIWRAARERFPARMRLKRRLQEPLQRAIVGSFGDNVRWQWEEDTDKEL